MRAILLQPPPGRRHQRPVIMLMLVAAAGSLLFRFVTDVPMVKAPADLDPPEPVFTVPWRETAETNGWAHIHAALSADAEQALQAAEAARAAARSAPGARRPSAGHVEPDMERHAFEVFQSIRRGSVPWEDAVVARVRRGGAMTERLEEAFTKPEFRPGVSSPFTPLWRPVGIRVEADFAWALRSGDTERARRCVSGLTRLSALILREGLSDDDYQLATQQRSLAARLTLELLTAAPDDRAMAAALAEEWNAESPDVEAGVRKLIRSAMNERPAANGDRGGKAEAPGLRSRPYRTWRLLIAEAGRIRDGGGLATAATLEEAPGGRARAGYQVPFPLLLKMDSNREGLETTLPQWTESYETEDRTVIRGNVFHSRAMRAALAVWLWRADHRGELPATLAELTPAYLKTTPKDPWTGGPLGWDPASRTITGTGGEWRQRARPPVVPLPYHYQGPVPRVHYAPGDPSAVRVSAVRVSPVLPALTIPPESPAITPRSGAAGPPGWRGPAGAGTRRWLSDFPADSR